MEKQNLKDLIAQLKAADPENKPYFGIFRSGTTREESCIEANKAGLEQFAATLLEAALESDQPEEDAIYYLKEVDDWIDYDSTTFIQYVRIVQDERSNLALDSSEDTPLGLGYKIGCIASVIILLVSSIIGIVTIFKWVL